MASPSDHVAYSGPLPIHVYARSAEGVYRITLEIDGKLIRNYGDATYHPTLSGAIDWQGAKHISFGWHTLTFLAYDKELNVSHESIEIDHLSNGSGYGSRPAHPRVGGRHRSTGKPRRKRVRRKHRHRGHPHG